MALRKYETQYLIKKVQKKRRIEVVEKKNNLIEIFPMMMKEIAEISAQKRKLYESSRMFLNSSQRPNCIFSSKVSSAQGNKKEADRI